jgi:6-phosphogluconolactonase (cycloisomerase 2 family)
MATTLDLLVTQTNDADRNEVLAFRRGADGDLTPLGAFPTGGTGGGEPHLPSQGSVTITGDGGAVLVTNAGSGDLGVLAVEPDGLPLVQTVPVGAVPRSVAEHDGLVYVLATGEPAVVGFRRVDGTLEPLEGSRRALEPDADPAQVGFTADGTGLVVTERGRDALVLFPVLPSGLLGDPVTTPSPGPTPYGFAATGDGVLVVTEAFGARPGEAAASSYRVGEGGLTVVTRSTGNGRSEICWAVATPDGRRAFTTNFADGAVSAWDVAPDGRLTLGDPAAGLTEDGRRGLRDEALAAEGAFLYAVDADRHEIVGWAVDADGRLGPIGSWGGLPATAAGLAAV